MVSRVAKTTKEPPCRPQPVFHRSSFPFLRRPRVVTCDAPQPPRPAAHCCCARSHERLGLTQQLAALLEDDRDPHRRQHARLEQVRQRVYQIALGYEDSNDADELRHDAVLQLACGAEGHALSSQPTLTRLEDGISGRELDRLRAWLEQSYVASLAPSTPLVVLDIDSTDDPAHGAQEQVAFHGFYDQHRDHPLLVFDGETGQLVTALLRPVRAHAARGAATILERLICACCRALAGAVRAHP